jgi:hypothetical protein
LTSYSTISLAVAAMPPPTTVLVCPGTYPEQVTINTPLTLKGLSLGTGSNPVITVPSGGVGAEGGAQVSVMGGFDSPVTVNISDLVVDGTGSGVNCLSGTLDGIAYVEASGTLENLTVRNQDPGGCGYGIFLVGSEEDVNTVNVRNSSIYNFDDFGIYATDEGEAFLVNLTSNSIVSSSSTVQAGVDYAFFSAGLAKRNTVILTGGVGLYLESALGGIVNAYQNTVSGANLGIELGLESNPVIKSNAILQSTTAAIELNCSGGATVENNVVFNAPTGIADVTPGDTIAGNTFYSVPTATSPCP